MKLRPVYKLPKPINKLLSGASQQTIAVSQASVEQAVANQKWLKRS
jgi:hypothetical protein